MQQGLQNWHYTGLQGSGSLSPQPRLTLPTLDTQSGQSYLEGALDFQSNPILKGQQGGPFRIRHVDAGLPPRPASTGSLGSWAGDRSGGCLDSSSVAGRRGLSGSPLRARPSSLAARRLAPRQRRGPSAAHAPGTACAALRPLPGARLRAPGPQIGSRRPAGAAVTRARRT